MPGAAFVNSVHAFPNNVSPSFTATAGNLIVVGIRYQTSGLGISVSSMTDTAGSTYVSAGFRQGDGLNDFLEVWYAENCLAHATNVVTVNWAGGTPTFAGIGVGQYSGVNTSSSLDTTKTGSITGSPVSASPITTSQANTLMVAFAQVAATGQTWSIPSGVLTTIRGQDSSQVMCLVDAIFTSIQTGVSADMSSGGSNAKAIGVAVFKAGSALTTNFAFQGYFD